MSRGFEIRLDKKESSPRSLRASVLKFFQESRKWYNGTCGEPLFVVVLASPVRNQILAKKGEAGFIFTKACSMRNWRYFTRARES